MATREYSNTRMCETDIFTLEARVVLRIILKFDVDVMFGLLLVVACVRCAGEHSWFSGNESGSGTAEEASSDDSEQQSQAHRPDLAAWRSDVIRMRDGSYAPAVMLAK